MKLPKPSKLRIIYYPDPVLKKVCQPVTDFGPELRALSDRMLLLMRQGKGVGLAAPQVGILIRMFVCNVTGEEGDDLVCVNPTFSELSGIAEHDEGCLSIPGVDVMMRRSISAVIEAFTVSGKPFRREGEQMVARIWQHEADHLEGRLITDNMSATDQIANRRGLKQLEADYAALHPRKRGRRCASS